MEPLLLNQYAAEFTKICNGGDGADGDLTAVLDTVGSVRSVSINAGGTGYSVNDVLTVTGPTTDATFVVTAVDEGVVTAIAKTSSGSGFTADGTGVATAVAPSGGTGCTLDTIIEFPIDSITINDGGTGYIGLSLRIPGATGDTEADIDVVLALGVIDSFTINDGGAYLTAPVITLVSHGPTDKAALKALFVAYDDSVQDARLLDCLQDMTAITVINSYNAPVIEEIIADILAG